MSRIILLVLALLLAACQPAPAAEITAQPPVKVAVPPSLAWLEGDLADCAASAGVAVLRADEAPQGAGVIALRLGEPPAGSYAAVLGEDRLAVIVHPDNPLTEMDIDNAQAIFAGHQKTWPGGTAIQAWSLPPGDDASAAMAAAGFTFANVGQAPTPQVMLKAVSTNPAAIGYLPARWLDSSVRELAVSGPALTLPILAVSDAEPQAGARTLLICLQERIK